MIFHLLLCVMLALPLSVPPAWIAQRGRRLEELRRQELEEERRRESLRQQRLEEELRAEEVLREEREAEKLQQSRGFVDEHLGSTQQERDAAQRRREGRLRQKADAERAEEQLQRAVRDRRTEAAQAGWEIFDDTSVEDAVRAR